MPSRRTVVRSLLLGLVGLALSAAGWFWRWSPSAYKERARLWMAGGAATAAEALLQEGVYFHGWWPFSTDADVEDLQIALLITSAKADNVEATKRYLRIVGSVPPGRAHVLAQAHAVIANDHFEAKRWRASWEEFLAAASHSIRASVANGVRSFDGAAEHAANAVFAASNGDLVEEARSALEKYVDITLKCEYGWHDDEMAEMGERHPEFRPANFDKLLAHIAEKKRR